MRDNPWNNVLLYHYNDPQDRGQNDAMQEPDFQPLLYESKVRSSLSHQPRQQEVIEKSDEDEPP